MAGTRRPGFSGFEKAEIWRGWKSGETFNGIGRVLGRAGPHVRSLVAANGGFVPPPRRRSIRVLSRVEREEISRGVAAGDSMRAIATVLKKELQEHLRTRRTLRRSRHATLRKQSRGQIVDAISISQRPAEVEDRAIPGHWEGDLIAGINQSYIATLVEPHSRFVMLVKVDGKSSPGVVKALIEQVRYLPQELRTSLTWDRGLEMARHKDFSVATDVDVYFCDPRSPWQRGTNENTNRLLRQYLPKRSDLGEHSQAELNKIALRLNQRPRKTLNFRCPADKLSESVALTT